MDWKFTMLKNNCMLKNPQNNKACANNRISYSYYKRGPSDSIKINIDIIWKEGVLRSFQLYCFPVYLKGEISEVRKYRRITMLDVIVNIFTRQVTTSYKLWDGKNNKFYKDRGNFRPGYLFVDNLFNRTVVIMITVSVY